VLLPDLCASGTCPPALMPDLPFGFSECLMRFCQCCCPSVALCVCVCLSVSLCVCLSARVNLCNLVLVCLRMHVCFCWNKSTEPRSRAFAPLP
jgi:hypothetical protein